MGNHLGTPIHKLKHHTTSKRWSLKSGSSKKSKTSANHSHLETFLLVWLDPHVDVSVENKATQKRLRKILTCLVVFDNVGACEKWLEKSCTDEKIILIVSGAYGEEIVPRIHHLQSIVTIYVYCLDVLRNQVWAKRYPKIRSVLSATDDLLKALSKDHMNLESIEDSKALQIYECQQQIYALDRGTASFLWFHLLVEILSVPRYLQSEAKRDKLIDILRQHCLDDESDLALIDRFEELYEPRKVASWLTHNTPLARFVNKALREQDINMLFALRFLLSDIHKQLLEHQEQSLNVFKLQLMLPSEMENLKANPGQLVIINGFLFASTNKSRLKSMITSHDQFQTVLFNIKANSYSGTAPFAFFRNLDSNAEAEFDREVLFMCGSIFKLGPLLYEENVWQLQLVLIGESDSPVLSNVKRELSENEILTMIGNLLSRCDQEERATIFYQELLDELPKEHSLVEHVKKQLLVQTRKANINFMHDDSFVLLNLSKHMTDFASTTLNTLRTLTSQLILLIDDPSVLDVTHSLRTETSLFTTAECANAWGRLPDDLKIFLLDSGNARSQNHQQYFSTIDELICRLVDEVVQKYRSDANEYAQLGDIIKAKQKNEQANQIYRELRKIHAANSTVNNLSLDIAERAPPILIWLFSKLFVDQVYINHINKHFSNYFSSIETVNDPNDHEFLSQLQDNSTDVFLIIHKDEDNSLEKSSSRFSTVKYVYQYVTSEDTKYRDNLFYCLISDLIFYHKERGEHYRAKNQGKKAREMFSKAKDLCDLMSEECFSTD